MTSEANKALEKFDKTANWLRNCYPKCKDLLDDLDCVRQSLTRLSELEPIIQELVGARKKATQGEWGSFYEGSGDFALYQVKADETNISHHYVSDDESIGTVSGPDSCMFGGEQSEKNAAFIALAANRIAKIGETK